MVEQDRDNINYRRCARVCARLNARLCGAFAGIRALKTGVENRKKSLQPILVECARHTSLPSLTDCSFFGQLSRFLQRESVGGCLYRKGPEREEGAPGIAAIFSLLPPGAITRLRVADAGFAEVVDGCFAAVHLTPLA